MTVSDLIRELRKIVLKHPKAAHKPVGFVNQDSGPFREDIFVEASEVLLDVEDDAVVLQ